MLKLFFLHLDLLLFLLYCFLPHLQLFELAFKLLCKDQERVVVDGEGCVGCCDGLGGEGEVLLGCSDVFQQVGMVSSHYMMMVLMETVMVME